MVQVDPIKDLTDDVEQRHGVGSANTEKDPHGLTRPRPQRIPVLQCPDGAVEDEVFRLLGQELLYAFILMS